VEQLLDADARVVTNDLGGTALDGFRRDGRVAVVNGDVGNPKTAGPRRARGRAGAGAIDALFNTPQSHVSARPEDYSVANWRRSPEVNLDDYFYIAEAVGRIMIERPAERSSTSRRSPAATGCGQRRVCGGQARRHRSHPRARRRLVRHGFRVNALCLE
jgi:NAD(P)-dependent dehydrogenase (short-subunit alcohol dehydrogenase family)